MVILRMVWLSALGSKFRTPAGCFTPYIQKRPEVGCRQRVLIISRFAFAGLRLGPLPDSFVEPCHKLSCPVVDAQRLTGGRLLRTSPPG